MISFFKKENYFIIASVKFMEEIYSEPIQDFFLGYCFYDNKLFHQGKHKPTSKDLKCLLDSYSYNCGVFSAIYKDTEQQIKVFTDPLGQYPVFYYINNSEFIISNDIWEIGKLLKKELKFNEDCMADYVTYQSALNQDTLIKGVKRLTVNEKIILEKNIYGGYSINIERNKIDILPFKYEELLDLAVSRFKQRSSAILEDNCPVVHLSGGVDSRLAYAALSTQGYKGPVFSFGGGGSQDRLIYEQLCDTFSLTQGSIKWFNKNISTVYDFLDAVKAFNGLKTNNFSNWGSCQDYDYCEVTGYFSGGLLKGYGDINLPISTSNFNYAKKVSGFDESLFNMTDIRLRSEKKSLLEELDNKLLANQLLYLRNRSSAHFGAHSMVSNQRFLSIDLLYDPLLLSLTNASPYSYDEISQSSVAIDLIRSLAGDKLAFFPYDNRVIKMTNRWKLSNLEAINCFKKITFPENPELNAISVQRLSYSRNENYTFDNKLLSRIDEFCNIDQARSFFDKYPIFETGLHHQNSTRKLEKISLATLVATYLLLESKR